MIILPSQFRHDVGFQGIILMQRKAFSITVSTILLKTRSIYDHKDFNQQQTWFVRINSFSYYFYLDKVAVHTPETGQESMTLSYNFFSPF
jgi:hypothetical protein